MSIDELLKNRNYIVQSWDTAFKKDSWNDFSVCTTWVIMQPVNPLPPLGSNPPNPPRRTLKGALGRSIPIKGSSVDQQTRNRDSLECGYYLIDLFRERVEFPELKRKAVELYERFRPNEILIEDKASGQSLLQELKRNTRIPLTAVKSESDKISRVHAITPLIEAGLVFIPQQNPLTEQLITEFLEFPDSEFDDIVDSVCQFLNYIRTRRIEPPTVMHSAVRRRLKVKG